VNPQQLWNNLTAAQVAWNEFANSARDLVRKGSAITNRGRCWSDRFLGDVELEGHMIRVTVEEDMNSGVPRAFSSGPKWEDVDVITFPVKWLSMPDEEWQAELLRQHEKHTERKRLAVVKAVAVEAERARQKKIKKALKVLREEQPEVLSES